MDNQHNSASYSMTVCVLRRIKERNKMTDNEKNAKYNPPSKRSKKAKKQNYRISEWTN